MPEPNEISAPQDVECDPLVIPGAAHRAPNDLDGLRTRVGGRPRIASRKAEEFSRYLVSPSEIVDGVECVALSQGALKTDPALRDDLYRWARNGFEERPDWSAGRA